MEFVKACVDIQNGWVPPEPLTPQEKCENFYEVSKDADGGVRWGNLWDIAEDFCPQCGDMSWENDYGGMPALWKDFSSDDDIYVLNEDDFMKACLAVQTGEWSPPPSCMSYWDQVDVMEPKGMITKAELMKSPTTFCPQCTT